MGSASDSHSLSVDFCSIPLVFTAILYSMNALWVDVLPVYLLLRFVLVSFLIIHGLHMQVWMLHQIVLCSNFDSERYFTSRTESLFISSQVTAACDPAEICLYSLVICSSPSVFRFYSAKLSDVM
jgi:hypothetical protein